MDGKLSTQQPHPLSLHDALEQSLLSDVTFIVGNETEKRWTFKLHKLILSLHSPVFKTMFCGSFDTSKPIEITDTSPHVFDLFVNYIYKASEGNGGDICVRRPSLNTLFELYHLADKYDVQVFLRKVVDEIKDLTPNNPLEVLKFSLLYNNKKLSERALDGFCDTRDILKSEAFLQADANVIVYILQERKNKNAYYRNDFYETEYWDALIQWCKRQCRSNGEDSADPKCLRSKLTSAGFFSKIEFKNFRLKDFQAGPAASGILTKAEITKYEKECWIDSEAEDRDSEYYSRSDSELSMSDY